MKVEEEAEAVGEAHPVARPEATAVLEEKEVLYDMELEIVIASVLSVVKLCWGKGFIEGLVVKVAVEVFEEVAEEVRL